jgi:hypothetical protein
MSSITPPCPADKPKRACHVWQPTQGIWVLTITQFHQRKAAQDTHYYLTAIPSDWGRAFEVKHLDADGGEAYHVHLTSDGPCCDCKGFTAHGHCKHAEGLTALDARGKLLPIRPPAPKPAPKPVAKPAPAPVVLQPVSAGVRADQLAWDSEQDLDWDLD